MSKVLIVYGSTTGNTEWVSKEIEKKMVAAGHETVIKKADQVTAAGLCPGYDLVAFGCSTWGMDEIEFQEDFIPLFEHFDKIEASGVKTAVFGCGDDSYDYYCGAVDAMDDRLKELGSQVVGNKLKINGDPEESVDDIESWATAILAAL